MKKKQLPFLSIWSFSKSLFEISSLDTNPPNKLYSSETECPGDIVIGAMQSCSSCRGSALHDSTLPSAFNVAPALGCSFGQMKAPFSASVLQAFLSPTLLSPHPPGEILYASFNILSD